MNDLVTWENESKSVIHCRFQGRWTWEDFHNVVDASIAMMREVEHRIIVIADFQDSTWLPPSNPLPQFRRAMKSSPANWGGTIIVGGGGVLKVMISVFRSTGREMAEKVWVASSLEEARSTAQSIG